MLSTTVMIGLDNNLLTGHVPNIFYDITELRKSPPLSPSRARGLYFLFRTLSFSKFLLLAPAQFLTLSLILHRATS